MLVLSLLINSRQNIWRSGYQLWCFHVVCCGDAIVIETSIDWALYSNSRPVSDHRSLFSAMQTRDSLLHSSRCVLRLSQCFRPRLFKWMSSWLDILEHQINISWLSWILIACGEHNQVTVLACWSISLSLTLPSHSCWCEKCLSLITDGWISGPHGVDNRY